MSFKRSVKKTGASFTFQVSDSITVLLITFIVAVFFAVLLCFYPGPEFLGANFWPLIALPGLLALGAGYKLLTRKPIVQVDTTGIRFFRSKIWITWAQVRSAQVVTVDQGDGDTEDYLVVKYLNAEGNAIVETDFMITAAMNKTSGEITAAIAFFGK